MVFPSESNRQSCNPSRFYRAQTSVSRKHRKRLAKDFPRQFMAQTEAEYFAKSRLVDSLYRAVFYSKNQHQPTQVLTDSTYTTAFYVTQSTAVGRRRQSRPDTGCRAVSLKSKHKQIMGHIKVLLTANSPLSKGYLRQNT